MDRAGRQAIKELLAVLLGAVGGAVAKRFLSRVGVKARATALGLSLAGAAGAALSTGFARGVAIGAAAAGIGQLASQWFAALDRRFGTGHEKQASQEATPPVPPRAPERQRPLVIKEPIGAFGVAG